MVISGNEEREREKSRIIIVEADKKPRPFFTGLKAGSARSLLTYEVMKLAAMTERVKKKREKRQKRIRASGLYALFFFALP